MPVYNLATNEDHIAPADSVLYGSQFFGGPVKYVLSGSGHIAGVVNPPAGGKYQYWTNDNIKDVTLADWLKNAHRAQGFVVARLACNGWRASTPSRCPRAPSAPRRCRRSRTRPAATSGSARSASDASVRVRYNQPSRRPGFEIDLRGTNDA